RAAVDARTVASELPAQVGRGTSNRRAAIRDCAIHSADLECADRCVRIDCSIALVSRGRHLAVAQGDLMRALRVALALLLVNGAITFHNVWPTLGIRWPGELSIELAVLLLVLSASNAQIGPTPRRIIGALAAVLVLFAIGRYAEVT